MNAERFPGVVAAQRAGRILADNAAGAQLPAEALAAVGAFLERDNAQKGTIFTRCERTTALIDEVKAAFASFIGVPHGTIGLGLNATSLAAAFARNLAPVIRPGDRIVVTAADHAANVVPWMWLTRFGAVADIIPVDESGDLDEPALEAAFDREPVLVALPWASNATGTLFDLARFARAAKDAGAIVVTDGVQAVPHARIDVPPGVDFAVFSAYKLFAPHAGLFYAHPAAAERFFRADDPLAPSAPLAWSMEMGTQNYEGWAGLAGTFAYLRDVGDGDARRAMDVIAAHERDLTAYVLARFVERGDAVTLYGRGTQHARLPVFAFNVTGERPEEVGRRLDAAGVEARVGDYYSPRLMQHLAPERGGVAVRFSFAHYSTRDDVDRAFAALDARGQRSATSARTVASTSSS